MKSPLWFFVLLSTFLVPAWPQDPTGTIEGRVVDESGGVIVNASSTLTNLSNGLGFEQKTTESGTFRFPLLPIGSYELAVEAPGFAKVTRRPIEISIGDVMRLSVSLPVATGTETVVVEGQAQLVSTADNTLGRVVSGREMVELPLNGRNFAQLGLLQRALRRLPTASTRPAALFAPVIPTP